MVFKLSEDKIWFPDAELADEDGLLAIGGDLFAVTPFAMLGGFDKSYVTTKYAIKGILKADLPIEGIDVGKISKTKTKHRHL